VLYRRHKISLNNLSYGETVLKGDIAYADNAKKIYRVFCHSGASSCGLCVNTLLAFTLLCKHTCNNSVQNIRTGYLLLETLIAHQDVVVWNKMFQNLKNSEINHNDLNYETERNDNNKTDIFVYFYFIRVRQCKIIPYSRGIL
jgi:hypothetical protein